MGTLIGIVLGLAGCSDALTGALQLPSAPAGPDSYWALELNYRAINIALTPPANSVQLAVTPRTPTGAVLTGVSTAGAQYTVLDTSSLRVTPEGMLTALRVGTYLRVVARLTLGGITHADTAFVSVVPAAPSSPLTTFSIQPGAGDSTRYGASPFGNKLITPVVLDGDGNTMGDLLVNYRSSDSHRAVLPFFQGGEADIDATSIVSASGASLEPRHPGVVTITTATYAFGVVKRDSVRYTITWPALQVVEVLERVGADGHTREVYFLPDTVAIASGGLVYWLNIAPGNTLVSDITFDQPAAATESPMFPFGSGNVPAIDPTNASAANFGLRQFLTPGTYKYHDSRGRSAGVIIVHSDP